MTLIQAPPTPQHARPLISRRDPSTRTLVLIDVENLTAGTHFTPADAAAIHAVVQQIASVPADAHVIVATSCGTTLVTAGMGCPGARLVWRPGPDGADLALADVALNEDASGRFDRVVIGSGDGMFAAVAAFLASRGLAVTVVARRHSLSRKLAACVHDVHVIDSPSVTAAQAAVPSQRPWPVVDVSDNARVTPLTLPLPLPLRDRTASTAHSVS